MFDSRARPPDAFGPPVEWVLPVTLPWTRVLGEGPHARVALERLRCWPDGVVLDIAVFRRRASRDRGPGSAFTHHPDRRPQPGGLRFGVLYADGRRATNLDRPERPARQRPDEDGRPVLVPRGGSGGQFHYRHEVYLAPLPPEGVLTVVVEWPDQGVPETRVELDATAVRAAAGAAQEVWPDLPPAVSEPPAAG